MEPAIEDDHILIGWIKIYVIGFNLLIISYLPACQRVADIPYKGDPLGRHLCKSLPGMTQNLTFNILPI